MVLIAGCVTTMAVASARYGGPCGPGGCGGGGGDSPDEGGHQMIEFEGNKVMFNGYRDYYYNIKVGEQFETGCTRIVTKSGKMYWAVFVGDFTASIPGKIAGYTYEIGENGVYDIEIWVSTSCSNTQKSLTKTGELAVYPGETH